MTAPADPNLELVPMAALGALDPGERAACHAHMAQCRTCRKELSAHEAVMAQLPLALDPASLPVEARGRVLAAARPPARVRPVRRSGRVLWPAAAFVLAIAVLAARWDRADALRDAARAREEWQAAQAELGRLRTRVAEAESLREVLAQPDSRTAVLAGRPPAPRARARVVWSAGQRQAVIVASGLDPTPSGRAYEVWVIGTGAPVPAGVFQVDANGRALIRLPAVAEIAEAKTFAVTLEPEAGTPAPTGPVVLAGAAS